MDIIAILPCLIIRLISPLVLIRIQRIPAGNFGDFALHPAMYYCKKKFKIDQPTKKHIDLVYIHYREKLYNKQLEKMWKRKLNFLSGYLLDPISRVNRLIPGWKNHAIKSLYKHQRDVDLLYEKCRPLKFTDKEEVYGNKMLNEFGLKDKDKFVCLAVRDGAYQQKKIPSTRRDWSYHDHRNTDVYKFYLAAEELTKRGYYVFRMGVVVEKPFSTKNPKIIDYANSNLRSDFMDIYLAAKCSFCVSSTGYGFTDLACLFAKPIVNIHLPFGDMFTYSEKFLFIIKHHILKRENRKLSLSEIFSHGVAWIYDSKIFKQKGIEIIDNTEEEIKDVVMEMVENLEFKRKLNSEEEELQKKFKSLYANNLERFSYQYELRNPDETMHGQIRSRFGTKFLKENKNWLK
jgi:putative glycosyltransferase (TIGR04372 family)